MMKGQATAMDLVLALTVFVLVILLFEVTWLGTVRRSDASELDMSMRLQHIAGALFESPGQPQDWNPSNVRVIGVADERNVAMDWKLSMFMTLVEENYSEAKALLGTGPYELYGSLGFADGTWLCDFGRKPEGAERIAVVRKAFVLRGSPVGFCGWRMFRSDAQHTGSVRTTVNITNLACQFNEGSEMEHSSPAVWGGLVFAGFEDKKLWALNESSCQPVWNFTTDDKIEAPISASYGLVFVASDDDRLRAINATTGTQAWQFLAGDDIKSGVTVGGGRLFFGSDDDRVYALNATSGALLWNYTAAGDVRGTPALWGDAVYFGDAAGFLYALSADTGSLLWRYDAGSKIESSPSVFEGALFFGTNSGDIISLDARTGSLLWASSKGTKGPEKGSSPAVSQGIVVIGESGGRLYALNATNGVDVWNYTAPDGISGSPAIGDGVVVFGAEQKLYVLDLLNGSLVGVQDIGEEMEGSSPVIADGLVFAATEDGGLFAFGSDPRQRLAQNGGVMVMELILWK